MNYAKTAFSFGFGWQLTSLFGVWLLLKVKASKRTKGTLRKQHNFPTLILASTITSLLFLQTTYPKFSMNIQIQL
jgi:hypothetical protein